LVLTLVKVSSAQKACVFLHGAGELEDGPPTTTFPEYWGDIVAQTPQCANHTFNHADTTHRRFDDPLNIRSYCALASQGTGLIRDTIIFTHSLGNVIFAAALRAGLCEMDQTTASWYGVGAPVLGTKAADVLTKVCMSASRLDEPLRELAALMHYCVSDTPGPPNLAYLSMETTDPGLAGLVEIFSANSKGMMCGKSAFGLFSEYSLGLEALSDLVRFPDRNDGMVDVVSCGAGANGTFGGDPRDSYYLAAVNHADTTCRNGNGDFGLDRQPCAWYSNRD